MKEKKLIWLLLAILIVPLTSNAGIFTDGAEAYSTIAKTTHDLNWWAIVTTTTLLIAMMASFRFVAGKTRSKFIRVVIGSCYILVELFCVMLVMIQFQDQISNIFDKVF